MKKIRREAAAGAPLFHTIGERNGGEEQGVKPKKV